MTYETKAERRNRWRREDRAREFKRAREQAYWLYLKCFSCVAAVQGNAAIGTMYLG